MVKKEEKDPHDGGREYVKGKKEYIWFEMSFFTRWDCSGLSQVLCVDIPPDFPLELQKLLARRSEPLDFRDPFAMHTNLVDQIVVHADVSVWRVRDPVRRLEKVSEILSSNLAHAILTNADPHADRCHIRTHPRDVPPRYSHIRDSRGHY